MFQVLLFLYDFNSSKYSAVCNTEKMPCAAGTLLLIVFTDSASPKNMVYGFTVCDYYMEGRQGKYFFYYYYSYVLVSWPRASSD